jgi:DNA-binding IclR family transcriptional regulator
MKDTKPTNRYSVPALEKTLHILETLALSNQALGITEITAQIKLPKTSIFMILTTLEEHGYLEKTIDGKYKLTLKLYDLGQSVINKLDLRTQAKPIMEQLSKTLEYTVHLAVMIDGKAVYIEKVVGPGFVQFSTCIGQSWHIHNSGVGKAMAAYLSDKELDQIVEKHGLPSTTSNTLTSIVDYKTLLESVRNQGYAIEDEEGEQGIRCIAAPIFDKDGNAIAAISITSIRLQLPSHRFAEVGSLVRDQALLLSSILGYKSNNNVQARVGLK